MKIALHSMCISKKKLKTCGGDQSCVRQEGSQFYAFNEQIFTNFSNIHKVMTIVPNDTFEEYKVNKVIV